MAAKLKAGGGHAPLQQREPAARQPRISPTKSPVAKRHTGRKDWVPLAYFFATKIYFAYCDLWFEAELRWMTLLFTARSRAEL